jgi:hypothetical protein
MKENFAIYNLCSRTGTDRMTPFVSIFLRLASRRKKLTYRASYRVRKNRKRCQFKTVDVITTIIMKAMTM